MRNSLRSHIDKLLTQPSIEFPQDAMDYSHWDAGTVVGDFYLDLFLQNPEATALRHPFHIASQLFTSWQAHLEAIIPFASQSMMSAPWTLPDLVDRQVDDAALLNKLTNALVFLFREYVDVKTAMEDDAMICRDLLARLMKCQAERAIGFPQTCVLRLMQVFAANPFYDASEALLALFAPLARKHQDPSLVLDIIRIIFEVSLLSIYKDRKLYFLYIETLGETKTATVLCSATTRT